MPWVVWLLIECELPVLSTHHDTHSAWLALGVFLPSFFFLLFLFFVFVFLWGLEAVNRGKVLSPLAAFLFSVLYFLCLVIRVAFWTWIDLDKFCNEMDQKGESMLIYIA